MTQHAIANYQHKCAQMVAPAGKSLKPPKTKNSPKKGCTKSPYRNDKGIAESKCLRKREARLHARRQGQAAVMNQSGPPPEGAYRKPGSMTR